MQCVAHAITFKRMPSGFAMFGQTGAKMALLLCEQVIAVSCLRLKRLELPEHIPISRLSIFARGHPGGLQISRKSKGDSRRLIYDRC